MGGGNTQTPLQPIAYRERDLRPAGKLEKGIEILNKGVIYWADTYAEALTKAHEAGHAIGH